MTMRFSEAEDTPVYSRSSADQVGRVMRYVINARAHQIAALHVTGRRGKALFVDWENVVGFGPDAVVIDDRANLRQAGNDYEELIARGRMELLGRRVLTDAGFDMGPLTDVEFDEATGRIGLIETRRARVRGDGLRTIGPYAVVVAHNAVDAPDPVDPPNPVT